jgi:3' terminal RNA ribose 2'-O-methyltransferase Hen1
MLLTLTTTHTPATDLGYLLAKHPAKVQQFSQTYGQAHVFYPEATDARCTAALLLDINPVGLVRREGNFALEQYVNDRPYVASSFLSVAIADVFRSALAGNCKEKPELAATPIPLEARIAALPCRGGEDLIRRLFEPLGYVVGFRQYPLDEQFPAWGESTYSDVTLTATVRLSDLLSHLYVLIPVLDNAKHYFVGSAEIDKLLRHGEGWLKAHPERDLIAARYLRYRKSLTRELIERLMVDEDVEADEAAAQRDAEEEIVERKISLHEQRLAAVLTALKDSGARRVLDLGCGEGKLLGRLLKEKQFSEIVGMDVAARSLDIAAERLHLDTMPPMQRQRITLLHGSLTYRDARLAGYDAAAVVEVIEHLDPPRLAAFERMLFEAARPSLVVITTPNAEYNVKWETLPAGNFRHRDHRFEWTRAQFRAWAAGVCERNGYRVRFEGVGETDEAVGAPSQMGVFEVV